MASFFVGNAKDLSAFFATFLIAYLFIFFLPFFQPLLR